MNFNAYKISISIDSILRYRIRIDQPFFPFPILKRKFLKCSFRSFQYQPIYKRSTNEIFKNFPPIKILKLSDESWKENSIKTHSKISFRNRSAGIYFRLKLKKVRFPSISRHEEKERKKKKEERKKEKLAIQIRFSGFPLF